MIEKQIKQRASLCVTIGIRQSALPSEKYYTKEEVDALIEEAGGGGGELKPATKDTLGGIIVGDGLDIAEDGTLSVHSYPGEYTVTPAVDAQTIPTSGHVMTDDLEIEAIPYVEVENPEGGGTVTIG